MFWGIFGVAAMVGLTIAFFKQMGPEPTENAEARGRYGKAD